MNELDAANAAPLASDSERSGAKMMLMYAVVLIVGFIAAIAVGVHFVKKYDANEQRVDSIKNAPVVLPEPVSLGYGKSHIPKIKPQVATNKIATQVINTPATPSFEGEKVPEFRQEKAEPEMLDQLNARLEKFNQQLLKGSL